MPPPHRAALLLAVLAAACGGRQPAPPPPPARAGDGGRAAPAPARAAATPAPPGEGWVGVIVARASVDLTAEAPGPFAGRVAERFVDAGAVVGPGTPILRLISGGDLLVRAAVPPEQARALAVGKAVTARVPTLGLDVPGHLERIAPQVDAAAQMIFVEARLDPTPAAAERLQTGLVVDLRPGG